MRKSNSIPRARKIRFRALLSAGVVLVSAAGLSTAANSVAGPAPAPTGMTATASTNNSALGGAVPAVLATAGSPISLTVTLAPAGATFNTDTALRLTASLAGGGSPAGSVSPATVTMPAGTTTATFAVSYSAVDNGVRIDVAVAKVKGKLSTVTPGQTAAFDVLKVLQTFASDDPHLATGLGVGDAQCTQASTESECGTLVLSHGFSSSAGALSLGKCTTDLGCTKGSQVVQFIADLGTAYSPTDPALLIVRCSKQQCGGGGVKTYTIKVSFSASGPLSSVAAPCAAKGVAQDAAGNTFCTDYVQSHRDNAGDVLLYLLFTGDMRAST
jgi:hypothetical protein